MIDRISTHVLNTTTGTTAPGIPVQLERLEEDAAGNRTWRQVGSDTTDADGRIGRLNAEPLAAGDFRLTFETADYLERTVGTVFYPTITLTCRLDGRRNHYHLPVLAGTYSASTYLGS